jgi:lysylphosphatidylglycerol synthetase-like protein (DUF2156 family)
MDYGQAVKIPEFQMPLVKASAFCNFPRRKTERGMERTVLKVFGSLAVRISAYAVLLAGMTLIMHQGAHWTHEVSFYGENGLIEWIQISFLLTSMAVLCRAGSLDKDRRAVLAVMILLLAATIVREWDKILDVWLGRHVWKFLSGGLIAAAAVWACRKRRSFYISALHLTRQPSFGIMLTGGLIVLVFSRLFGAGEFWQEMMDDRRIAREVKQVAEECTELMGYFFIMIGTFEHLHETHIRKRRRTPFLRRTESF